MDSCENMLEAISLLLDGELGPTEERALREHLAECPRCKRSYDALRAFSASLQGEEAEPPETLRENVMATLRREALRKRNRRIVRFIASAAAVAALALGLRLALPRLTEERELAASARPVEAASGALEEFEYEESFDAAPRENAVTRSAASSAEASVRLYDSGEARVSLAELLAWLEGEALPETAALPAEPVATLMLADGTLALYELDGALCYYEPGGALLRTARGLAEIENFGG